MFWYLFLSEVTQSGPGRGLGTRQVFLLSEPDFICCSPGRAQAQAGQKREPCRRKQKAPLSPDCQPSAGEAHHPGCPGWTESCLILHLGPQAKASACWDVLHTGHFKEREIEREETTLSNRDSL